MAKVQEYPEEGDLVVCTVKNVRNFGAFVMLEEYDQREGFIHVAEIASGWVKRMSDYVREGQRIVCKVQNVDPAKGHIDLSLKKVNDHQKREKIQDWKNEQRAFKLLEIVGERIGKDVKWCRKNFGDRLAEEYSGLYHAFEDVAAPNAKVDKKLFKGEWVDAFVDVAKENVTPALVSIEGYLELTSNAPDGIKNIQEALIAGEKDPDGRVRIQYIGAPRYRIVVTSQDYKNAEEVMKEAVDRATKSMERSGGAAKFSRKEKA